MENLELTPEATTSNEVKLSEKVNKLNSDNDLKKSAELQKKKDAKKSFKKEKIAKEEKKDEKLTKINFSKFAEKLNSFSVKEKMQKSTLYNYPEGWTALNINGDEGRTFRRALRLKLTNFSNNIFVYCKTKQTEKLIAEVKNFDKFYKLNYKINDYSINSITHTKEEKNASYVLMLDIIKEVKK